MIDHFTPPAFFKTVRGMEHEQLFTEFNVSTARNLSLSSEVRMRAEYNILEKRKWRNPYGGEKHFNFFEWEVVSAKDRNTLLEQECDSLKLKVTGLESAIEYQDELMEPLRTRLAEIDTDFTRCCMRFQESFHPHLLNVIAGRRWLLTHGMKLLMVKCLNSNEYMEALGHAFGRAIEKGMQEGLSRD
ncbi:hypothetical protein Tco_0481908 [Tanacetum coccineum]